MKTTSGLIRLTLIEEEIREKTKPGAGDRSRLFDFGEGDCLCEPEFVYWLT